MTTMTQRTSRPETGHPVVFGIVLAVAALLVLGLLISGPWLPLAGTMVLAISAVGLVLTGWVTAGPRW